MHSKESRGYPSRLGIPKSLVVVYEVRHSRESHDSLSGLTLQEVISAGEE